MKTPLEGSFAKEWTDIKIPDLRINEIQYIEDTLNVNKVTFLWRPKLPYRETPSIISGFSILGW